jgi:hypothetical protein
MRIMPQALHMRKVAELPGRDEPTGPTVERTPVGAKRGLGGLEPM